MSFSVSDRLGGTEYSGSSLNTLFAQRRNIISPRFLTMTKDILRFNSQAEKHLLENPSCAEMSLSEYLDHYRYSAVFRELYLLPMGAAIWSSNTEMMLQFPLQFFVRFFRNHGLLNIKNRPQWRVIKGGSRAYIAPLTENFKDKIELDNPVRCVTRFTANNDRGHVRVESERFTEDYDQVIFACHSDQALAMLAQPSAKEKAFLSAIAYTKNDVVLHTDERLLPRNRRCWSSWNVSLNSQKSVDKNTAQAERPTLTYDMNILQGIESEDTFCVTLNQTQDIDESLILGEYEYDHPVFTEDGMKAQQRWHEINGLNNTWFCGAYWRNGFHEDGVWSALRVTREIEKQESSINGQAQFDLLAEAG